MTREENSSFVYKNVERNTEQNISKLIYPIKKDDIIEQFSKLHLSDDIIKDHNLNNETKKSNCVYLKSEKQQNTKNINLNENKNKLEKVHIKKEEKLSICHNQEEFNQKIINIKTELLPIQVFLERSPVRNDRSHCKVSISPYPCEVQLQDLENILNHDKINYNEVNSALQEHNSIANINSSIPKHSEDISSLPDINSYFLQNNTDYFPNLELHTNIKTNEIIKCENKDNKIREICEFLKNKDFNEIPQLTNIISKLESHVYDKKESFIYNETTISTINDVRSAPVQTPILMPSSPQQAATPPQIHVAVIPDLSHNATTFTNYDLAKTVEPQNFIPVSSPLPIGLYKMIINEGKNKIPRERRILPKIQSRSEENPKQRSTIINTREQSTRLHPDNKTVQEHLGSRIPSEVKRDFMKNFMKEIKNIEEIIKPIESDGKTILHKFVSDQDINKTYLLVEQIKSNIKSYKSTGRRLKDYIDIKDKNGYTPLFYAVKRNCKNLTAYLRECGSNSYIKDSVKGNTPFHIATKHGNKALTIMQLLNEANEANNDVNITNRNGETVLHTALKQSENLERDELIKFLLKKKYKVSSQDNMGRTPLHYAVKLCSKINKLNILEILLTEGCDSSIAKLQKDFMGISILHEAARQNHMPIKCQKEMIDFLIVHCDELLETTTNDGRLPYQLVPSDRLEVKNALQYKWDNTIGYIKL